MALQGQSRNRYIQERVARSVGLACSVLKGSVSLSGCAVHIFSILYVFFREYVALNFEIQIITKSNVLAFFDFLP